MTLVLSALVAGVVTYVLNLRLSRFQRRDEKRAEVLSELSGLLFDVEDKFKKWYSPSLRSPQAGHTMEEIKGKVAERGKAAIESTNAFTRCYHRNAGWLDPDLAARVEGCIDELHQMLFDYGKLGVDNTFFHTSEGGIEAAKRMEERLPEIRAELIDKVRRIVHPLTAWSVLRALLTTPSGQRKLTTPDSREDR